VTIASSVTSPATSSYVVAMIPRTRSSHDIYPGDTVLNMKDWRAAISTPLTYRIGNSTVHFRSHLVFAGTLIAVAVLMLFYFTQTGRARSNFVSVDRWGSRGGLYNSSYPLTPGVRLGQGTRFRIAVVADLDKDSKVGESWVSYLHYGYLTISESWDRVTVSWVVADLDKDSKVGESWVSYLHYGYLTISESWDRVSVSWDVEEVELKGNLAAGGRGMELSELQVFNGKLLSLDDRTGEVKN